MADEQSFVFQTIYGVDDVIVSFDLETISSFCAINLLERIDFGGRVDGQQAFFECFHFDLTDGFGSGHQLSVDVGYANSVRIDNGEIFDARTHQTFCAPASYSAYAEDDNSHFTDLFESGISH